MDAENLAEIAADPLVAETPSVTITLRKPIPYGKGQSIESLELKPNARAFRDFGLPMGADKSIVFQPYPLAVVGLKLAGHHVNAAQLVDKLDSKDMHEIAMAVFGFMF